MTTERQGLQERADARRDAAQKLLALAEVETNGLVREEMLKGVARLQQQEIEFLEYAAACME